MLKLALIGNIISRAKKGLEGCRQVGFHRIAKIIEYMPGGASGPGPPPVLAQSFLKRRSESEMNRIS